ncbi:helix-turn-helix transcriptional regulator [Companilactobacillus sp.]|uniref:helix-turn-helix domain-containing protein n=1 Tax=Companilactobacillus sp. TaxID=2767905 RepID=UPI002628B570|nr:helix-turn-helix transcriptional regulator [Companilactobacillus sp.]
MSEQQVVNYFTNLSNEIKKELLDRNMSQRELARSLNLNPQQMNRAIKGGMTPKDKLIRVEIKKILGIKEG